MKKAGLCILSVLLTALLYGQGLAKTPKDVLVMAAQIDDMVSVDPAEIFEFSGSEYAANTYDRLIAYDVEDVSNIFGMLAESWEVGEDDMTYTFKIRKGVTFASGNPLTAHDVVYSLQRVVALNKSPAFIITQFGFTPENMAERIKAVDDETLVLVTDKPYAPTFFLYCLTSTPASVVDSKLVREHEKDGDYGYGWLKTNYAGSGPFTLASWKPAEMLLLDANPNYWNGKPAMKRIIIRHIGESATQQLLLEKGDVDIARDLGPDQFDSLKQNSEVKLHAKPKGGIWYLGLNQKNEILANPKVREALRYLIDYQGMADTLLRGTMVVHQAYLPVGFLGALEEKPFSLDVEKAKALLTEAGYPDGFTVTMDTRNSSPTMEMAQAIQATMAKAGVTVELLPMDGKQALTKYRARNHDIYIGRWGPDYQDPHTNASTFAFNRDNSDEATSKPLAWRNAWDIPEMSAETEAAIIERDPAVRAEMYLATQRKHQANAPFIIMFQETEVVAERVDVKDFILGPSFDSNFYRHIKK
ncbi:MAG: ABC transporter substrate-binding protein [Deltaproteobacteria bacterium]|nr:MAG: ABC transporter substrate-binding protein [Deltaproteobacteria bacterium]